MSIRDTNIFVAAPPEMTSTGSYVGVETNDTAGITGSIQIRNSAIGVVLPGSGEGFTASDILQTTPVTFTTPSYSGGPGILIGPGTELVTKTAGDKGFSVYNYTSTVFYGVIGLLNLSDVYSGRLLPGTLFASAVYPAHESIAPYYRVQNSTLIMGISCELGTGPVDDEVTGINFEVYSGATDTLISSINVTFMANEIHKARYDVSIHLDAGDYFQIYLNEITDLNLSANLKVYVYLF
jgi:hypothetical protein